MVPYCDPTPGFFKFRMQLCNAMNGINMEVFCTSHNLCFLHLWFILLTFLWGQDYFLTNLLYTWCYFIGIRDHQFISLKTFSSLQNSKIKWPPDHRENRTKKKRPKVPWQTRTGKGEALKSINSSVENTQWYLYNLKSSLAFMLFSVCFITSQGSQVKNEQFHGAPGWLRRLSICLQLRSWSQGPGMAPCIRLPAQRGLCFFLCLASQHFGFFECTLLWVHIPLVNV